MKTSTVPMPDEVSLTGVVLFEGTDDELHDLFELLALAATPAHERRRRRQLAEPVTYGQEVAA